MKLTVTKTSIEVGGTLHDLFYNKTVGRYDLSGSYDNGNTIVQGEIDFTRGELNKVLTNGGLVEEYLMCIVADIAILDDNVPGSMPNPVDVFGDPKTFKTWLDSTAEVWIDSPDINIATKIYLFSNPIGTTRQQYLTGTQLRQLYIDFNASRNLDVITISAFNQISGLTKI